MDSVSERIRILIVDDDEGTRCMIRRLLSMERMCEIEEAKNGLEADEKLKTFKADLIILDIMMPGKDGYKTFRDIRRDISMKDVKIIGFSGISGDISKVFVEEFGADRFLEKPFSSSEFKEIISELLTEESRQ